MKNDVILITTYYPFGETSEAFITPELHAVDYDAWNMKVIAGYQAEPADVKQDCPPSVRIGFIGQKGFSVPYKIFLALRIAAGREFYRELRMLKRRGKLNMQNLGKLASFSADALDKYRSLIAILKRDGYIPKRGERRLVLYAYWMDATACALAMLSEKYGFPSVCRVHGADLYEERNEGYLPMRGYIIRHMSGIFPISNAGRTYLTERYGHGDKIRCSYIGSRNASGPRKVSGRSPFRIVSCAYVIPLKRIGMIAEAVCGIEDAEVEWVHFGGGPGLAELERIVGSAKPNVKCRLMGNVSSGELMEYYAHNDVHLFINFSTTEGIPQSIKEAMSFGIPAIATDVGGNSEIVRDGVNGRLLDVDTTVEELRGSVMRFIGMEDTEYLRFREEAYGEWDRHFNTRKTTAGFYEEIGRLLK